MDSVLREKYYIFNELAECKPDFKKKIFEKYYDYLDGVTVIFVKENYHNTAIQQFNETYNNVRYGYLSNQFYNDNIFILNKKNLMKLNNGFRNKIYYAYDINLDTNVVSYIDRLVEKKLNDNIHKEVAKMFIGKRRFISAISIQPYIFENTLFKDEINEDTKRTVKNFFTAIFKSHSISNFTVSCKVKSRIKNVLKNFLLTKNDFFHDHLRKMYKYIYVVFLKMYLLQTSKVSFEKKAKKLIEFVALDLKKISILEMTLALEFFKKGTKLKFFSKFQKNSKNIIKDIQNAAWDIHHLRSLDFLYIFGQHRTADITIPFLYSLDKNFNEVRKLVELHTLIIDKKIGWVFPFYKNNIVQETVKRLKLDDMFCIKESSKRYDLFDTGAVENLIRILELEIKENY
ncbi:MAG: hypothetical protein CVV60_01260 [Tenericutes bacterium HGW-Tenericutes-5]|nr:MAG: hypothetical protein CVV60_01260 [Tenericutes bacterium HGW-Tenericutes-5]